MPKVTVAVHHHDTGVPPTRPGRARRSRSRPAPQRSHRGASRTAQEGIVADIAGCHDQKSPRGLLNRWLSRKSRSLVTTTRSLLSATSAIRASVVQLPSGSSNVCSTSCPTLLRNRASRAGSWASTRNFTPHRVKPPCDGPTQGRRTPARRGDRHAQGPGSQRALPRSSYPLTRVREGSRRGIADREPSVGHDRSPGPTRCDSAWTWHNSTATACSRGEPAANS
jgi:hypothetical protein